MYKCLSKHPLRNVWMYNDNKNDFKPVLFVFIIMNYPSSVPQLGHLLIKKQKKLKKNPQIK